MPRYARFARNVWGTGLASLLLALVSAATGALLPLGTKVLIDYVVLGTDPAGPRRLLERWGMGEAAGGLAGLLRSPDFLVAALLALGLASVLAQAAQSFLQVRFQQEVTFNLQTSLFDHLLRFPLSFFRKGQTGYLVSRVSDDVHALQTLLSNSLLQLASNVFYLLFGLAVLWQLNPGLTLVSAAVLPFYVLANRLFARRQRSASLDERESSARVTRDLHEVIAGVELVKSHAAERREVSRVSGSLRSAMGARTRALLVSLVSGWAVRGVQFAATLLIMWLGAREIRRGAMSIGDYVAFTAYTVYLSGSVRTLSLFHIIVQPLFASLDRISELFAVVPEDGGVPLARPASIRGEVRFEGVTFGYEEGRPVLRDVTFRNGPGEVLAIVGPSGSGKTTVANLLLKFYRPWSGRILLDGTGYDLIDTAWLRGNMGVVSQEVFLFDDTLEGNIRYGRPGASREQVREAARLAGVHEEIEALPLGYDTVVGERGASLSLGQRQRISLARAFLRRPPILILDEPTSALDAEAERKIRDSLRRLLPSSAIFVISHRPGLVEGAGATLDLGKPG